MENSNYLIDKIKERILDENSEFNCYIVPEKLAKNIRSYMSMNSDIKFAIEATKELINISKQNDSESVIKAALWKSSIVIYGKCFTDASKSKQSKLEAKECFKNETHLLDIHNDIMDARHGFVAHRSDNDYEKSLVYFKIPKDKVLDYTEFGIKSLRAFNDSVENLQKHLELFSHIETHITQKFKKQFNAVLDIMKKTYTAEEIHNLLIK